MRTVSEGEKDPHGMKKFRVITRRQQLFQEKYIELLEEGIKSAYGESSKAFLERWKEVADDRGWMALREEEAK